jgi:acetoin utilization deacetylase AcuC-like enzyme
VLCLHHADCLLHDPGPGHPENPDRLRPAIDALQKAHPPGGPQSFVWREPRPCPGKELERVHEASYVGRLLDLGPDERAALDWDTILGPGTVRAARLAAGAALEATAAVWKGEHRAALSLMRPPGHHARPSQAMGFCFFNNVAVAAAHLVEELGAGRVLLLDWDVHHGNGTQEIFYEDPRVLYVSLHRYPFYPGTGAAEERGSGEGEGFTLNVPLAGGSDDDTYRRSMEEVVEPAVSDFAPEIVLISAGFDAHRDDPLGGMAVTDDGYAWLTTKVDAWASDHASGRVVTIVEGGYNPAAVARCLRLHVERLLEKES